MAKNRCFRLVKRPQGKITSNDLKLSEEDVPEPQDDQVLVKNLYLSVDPTHRIWMSDRAQYIEPVKLGDIMRTITLGVIEKSKNSDWKEGSYVIGDGGICDYYIGIPGVNISFPVPDKSTIHLSVASVIVGLTAWHGVNKILKPSSGDICVVSGAAGAVGSVVAQLCKFKGAQVVGIAGGPEKCSYLKDELNVDLAIDYRSEDIEKSLKDFAPDGVTHYYDNVGGSTTDSVLQCMKNYGTVALCGTISEYNDEWEGVKNYNMIFMRRLTVTGFISTDHMDEYEDASKEIRSLLDDNKLRYKEDIREGLENYVDVVNLLFTGKNTGKLMIKV